jgi:hypothetical protein
MSLEQLGNIEVTTASKEPEKELSITGQNLLQPHHAEFGGEPGPLIQIKRSAYGKVTPRW